MRRTVTTCLTGLLCALPAAAAAAAPQPGLVVKTWQLDFEFEDPQRISMSVPGESGQATFWYVLFRVTNNTGRDVQFLPSFRLVTDTLEVVQGGADVPPQVYDRIFQQHKNSYPFIAPPFQVTGPLLQGPANSRSSVMIFRDFDNQADGFTIYVAGLSGDIAREVNPAFDPDQPAIGDNVKYFLVRRTLAIKYALPGDAVTRRNANPIRKKRTWVMR